MLDVVFRLENSFGIKICRTKIDSVNGPPGSITAGEAHERGCRLLRERGQPGPPSSWRRVQSVLSEATGTPPRLIRRDTRLRQDLRIT
jgi:hypothetical protein